MHRRIGMALAVVLVLVVNGCAPRDDGIRAGGPALDGRIQGWTVERVGSDPLPPGLTFETPLVDPIDGGVRIRFLGRDCTPGTVDRLEFTEGVGDEVIVEVRYPTPSECPAIIAFTELVVRTDGSVDPSAVVVQTFPTDR